MTNDLVQFVIAALAIVLGAAFEELLPKAMGVGFPVLLAAVPFMAFRRGLTAGVLFALAAGAMEEAISALPPMTCGSYFVLVALLAHLFRLPLTAAVVGAVCLQAWLAVWMVGLGGGVFVRILAAAPVGLVTAVAVGAALSWAWRKAAVDECG